jgi:ATP-dependent RNA helicase SUPV3L1/SUV3
VGERAVERLWDVCQVPDYRKIAPANHAELLGSLYSHLMRDGVLPEDWFAAQVAHADRPDGDLDTLANRIAHIRTWTFVANRPDWLADPAHWQETTRAVEDRLSDALHERLIQRFVDRRTSVLARRLRENAALDSEIAAGGAVTVEGHHVGHLSGLSFVPDAGGEEQTRKAASAAAAKVLAGELTARAEQLAGCADGDIVLSDDGVLNWKSAAVGRLERGENVLAPRAVLLADELLAGAPRQKAEARLSGWLAGRVETLLAPLVSLERDGSLSGMTRGLAFQIAESLGVLDRARVADEVKALPQEERASLRRHGVRFGAHNLFVPALLKPAPRVLAARLWALHEGGIDESGFAHVAELARSGRMSVAVDGQIDAGLYRAFGYQLCGVRAIRVDILERLADLIRAALSWRPGSQAPAPEGAVDGRVFTVSEAMTSLAGCAGDDFAAILTALGYRSELRPNPAANGASPAAAPSGDPVATADDVGAGAEEVEPARPAEPGADDSPLPGQEGAVPDVPTEIVVWRPGRRSGHHQHPGRRQAQSKPADAAGQDGPAKKSREGRRKGKPRPDAAKAHIRPPRKPAKQPDPSSPFAALAGLRDELAKRDS